MRLYRFLIQIIFFYLKHLIVGLFFQTSNGPPNGMRTRSCSRNNLARLVAGPTTQHGEGP
ncbi:hypothetical protein HanPSC8_Chr10g0433551 [Helianthus annuus]|nr:hypothetical protein HanPSC8_Chr10g0433551 [Helianthus annuus]